MSREREHKYLLTLNSLPINIITILLMIGLSFFVYWVIDYTSLDIEVIKLDFINRFGHDFLGFLLYGLRYVLFVFGFFILYEFLKSLVMGVKNTSFICRIENGDFYIKSCKKIYKYRVILSLLISLFLFGLVPIVLGLYLSNILILIVGCIAIVFNVRDIVLLVVLLTIKNKVYKYTDYKNKNQFVLEIRKDFNIYKNLFIKSIKCIDDDECDNEDNIFVVSRVSLLVIALLIVGTIVGVVL